MSPLRSTSARSTLLIVFGVLSLLAAGANLVFGTADIELGKVLQVIAYKLSLISTEPDALSRTVIWDLRLPRVILAASVGAGLSLSGAVMQGLFRNPLADPGIIGVSSGAAAGGVLAILLGGTLLSSVPHLTEYALPTFAILGGVGVTFLIYRLSSIGGRTHIATMLLTGIAVNALAAALIGFAVTRFADDAQIRSITFWTLGSLMGATWQSALSVLGITILGAIYMLRQGRALNAFLLGESEAFQLGVSVQTVKRLLIFASAALVGITVAACGIIGFVGLVVPHMVRLTLGPDHRWLLPGSIVLGAATLLVADFGARTLVAPAELQIGILTALIGGPFFLGLLMAQKRKFSL